MLIEYQNQQLKTVLKNCLLILLFVSILKLSSLCVRYWNNINFAVHSVINNLSVSKKTKKGIAMKTWQFKIPPSKYGKVNMMQLSATTSQLLPIGIRTPQRKVIHPIIIVMYVKKYSTTKISFHPDPLMKRL